MTIALRPSPTAEAAPVRLAGVVVFDTLAGAEPHWRALERGQALMSPYQRFAFLSQWQRHIGSAESVEPWIVVGFDTAGLPLLLLPLGLRRHAGFKVAEFLGGKHASFNLGLWRRDFVPAREALDTVFAALSGKADALQLLNQPLAWQGEANPLAMMTHCASASMGHSGSLGPDFETLLNDRANAHARKNLRRKERNLATAGTVEFARAKTAEEIARALTAFFDQKQARMKALGLPDVFSEPKVQRFIGALAQDGVVELYALSVNGEIIATQGGLAGSARFSAMFSSIIPERFASESPGEQILVRLVRDLCARGFVRFDLGVGEARYKDLFCNEDEPLIDSFIPLSVAGAAYVRITGLAAAAKRQIKTTPALWALVGAVRRLRARLTA